MYICNNTVQCDSGICHAMSFQLSCYDIHAGLQTCILFHGLKICVIIATYYASVEDLGAFAVVAIAYAFYSVAIP